MDMHELKPKECRWIDVGNLLKVTHWMPIPELPKEDA